MEIIPDPIHTALLTLPFLVALGGLHFILFRPLLAYLDEREHTVEKASHEATDLHAAADDKLVALEARLEDAREQVRAVHKEARNRAQAREAEILAAARREADQEVSEALARIAEERKAASTTLRSTADELSRDIASQVLGRQVA